jgi:quinol monooxygenase YgiN
MNINNYRRSFLVWLAALPTAASATERNENREVQEMYGLIGRIIAVSGKRDELASILISGVSGMPGCISYVVASDTVNEDALWVTEVWENKEKHLASLSLESVQEAIKRGRPLIKSFSDRHETTPLGGYGV